MGSVTAITDKAGAVKERFRYTAFGVSQVMTPAFANRSISSYDWQTRFHGEQRDAETGYYNYGHRFYLPELGRWPSRDPIEERGGLNLYGMVGNDAVGRVDLLGLMLVPPPPDPNETGPTHNQQLQGYNPDINYWKYFKKRFPNFMKREESKMFDRIREILLGKCKEMPGEGELEDRAFSSLFTSQTSSDLRGNADMDPLDVTEHPDDDPQGRYHAKYALGQFVVGSANVKYKGWVEDTDCKCGIDWDGEIAVFDTPGVTYEEDGTIGWVLWFLGVPADSPPVKIASNKVGGYICCDEK